MLGHEGAIRSNQDPLATPLLASKAQGSPAFDSTQFDDFIRFFLNLNLGQKTTKRSLPGIVIKELLMLYWFEKSQSLTVIDIKNTLPIDPKLIDRLLAYFPALRNLSGCWRSTAANNAPDREDSQHSHRVRRAVYRNR